MAEELFRRIEKQSVLARVPPEVPFCLGADGSQLKTQCRATIAFNIGPFPVQHSFLVLSKLRHQAILGSDFLEDKECNVDFPNRKLRFVNGCEVDLHRPNKRVGLDMPVIMRNDPLAYPAPEDVPRKHAGRARRAGRRPKREEETPPPDAPMEQLEETPLPTSSPITPLMSIKFPPDFKDPRTGRPIDPESTTPTARIDVSPSLAPLDQEETEESTPWETSGRKKRTRQRRRSRDATAPNEKEQEIERRALTGTPAEPPIPTYNKFALLSEIPPPENTPDAPKPQRPPRAPRRRNPQRPPPLDSLQTEEPNTKAPSPH